MFFLDYASMEFYLIFWIRLFHIINIRSTKSRAHYYCNSYKYLTKQGVRLFIFYFTSLKKLKSIKPIEYRY